MAEIIDGVIIYGKEYEFQNSSGGVSEAPYDGKTYGRKNNQWNEIVDIPTISKNLLSPDNVTNGILLATGLINDNNKNSIRTTNLIKIEPCSNVILMRNPSFIISGLRMIEYRGKDIITDNVIKVTQLSSNVSTKLSEETSYIGLSLNISEITSENYKDIASQIGVAISLSPIPFEPYSSTIIDNEVYGIHRHLNKLKWIAMGDSITDGSYSDVVDDKIDIRNTCWVKYVADICNYLHYNVGIGGTGWIKKGSQGDRKNAKEQVDDIDFSEYDICTMAFGINDYKSSDKIEYGTITDEKTENTVVGSMKYCIEKILNDNPFIRLIIITPSNCNFGTFETNHAIDLPINEHTLGELYEIMISVCKYYGIPYIDMTYKGIFNRYSIPQQFPNPNDAVHPTLEGHKRMAYYISQEMKYNN